MAPRSRVKHSSIEPLRSQLWQRISNNVICEIREAQTSLRSLIRAFDSCLNIHMNCLSLKWGYTGSSESIHVKMPHRWKSCLAAHILMCPSLSRCEAGMNEWPSNRSTYVVCVRAWRDGMKFSQASPVSQSCVLEKDTFILRPRKTIWYVRPTKSQISLRIRAVWSEPLLVPWRFYEC